MSKGKQRANGSRSRGGGKRRMVAQTRSKVTGVDYTKASRSVCSTGKWSWQERADAKRALKSLRSQGHHGMRSYLCPECQQWHVGHLPRVVREGEVSAADYYGDGDGDEPGDG